jgi:hypothetical protein
VGVVTFNGSSGVVAPGASPGILTCSNFNAGTLGAGTLQVELNGTTPGTGYDQLSVQGTVALSGITLSASSLNFVAALSNQFVIINNDGTDVVVGTFNGLAQNSSYYVGDQIFRISYTGGDGNDVMLTKIGDVFHPTLSIEAVPPNSVRLLWQTNDPGFGLQSNTNLATNNWAPVSPAPVILDAHYLVTNPATGTQNSYRLFKP